MGIFDSVFGKKQQTETKDTKMPWIFLESMEQLDTIETGSKERPQVIFKHSSTCGISSMVLKMFNGSYDPILDCDLYFLTIQAHRDLSNAIADKFGVRHESPQLLVIKNGKVSFHTSHGAIADLDLKDYL
ncbi:bacillithiol system protein YtxJ [Flagellimonas taeanensis]|uniref:Bacillithiol system protein YtxJ n=2 Tax=Flagellimonas taeanensis TaxID=1005926 RepID=A0A1M7BZH3_9FLAO|nr:bacillithiol system protein YtxJ [Allomuricauda taeanensis]SHL60347.1 bacillithiol system protein YtxJ [Allomuricauda taeanensis]